MGQLTPIELKPDVGIQRDGTMFDTTKFTNGSWTRFYKNRAQKMGGYTIVDNGNNTIIRNLFSINTEDSVFIYVGRPTGVSYFQLYPDFTASGETTVFTVSPADTTITWSFATISYSNKDYILAMPLPNATDISSNTPGVLYSGRVGVPTTLTPVINVITTNPVSATGGVTVVGNFVFVFGSGGLIKWNDGNSLFDWPIGNFATFETTQFVAAAPVRSGPTLSALFWSLDFVAQLSYQPSTTDPTTGTFQRSYVSTQSTLLSSNAIVSLDPFFYWIGNNSFYQFNASVVELQNTTNKEWFFQNVNRIQKEKVFGVANRIYNEIWWLFPYGSATENTNACIFSVENQTWFDTDQIPRSCAISSTTQFPYPLMASSQPILNGANPIFPIWAHEYGTDKVQLGQTIAITASFESNWISANNIDQSMDLLIVDSIIPDIKQIGDMTVKFNLRGYPNSPAVTSDSFVITPTTEFLTVRQKASIFSATFTSNVSGGNFLMGKTRFLVKAAGDERPGPATT